MQTSATWIDCIGYSLPRRIIHTIPSLPPFQNGTARCGEIQGQVIPMHSTSFSTHSCHLQVQVIPWPELYFFTLNNY